MFTPRRLPGSTKYGDRGLFSPQSFKALELPEAIENVLIEAANHSIAQSTWSVYRTAVKNLEECRRTTGKRLEFPLSTGDVMTYVGWLLGEKLVRPGTVESYLSGLRKLH